MAEATEPKAEQSIPKTQSSPIGVYIRQVVTYVVFPFFIDMFSVAIILSLLWAIAQGLVRVIQSDVIITPYHINEAAVLLGLCYLIAITVTVSRRFYYTVINQVKLAPIPPAPKGMTKAEDTQCSN